jgi:hypothetical protein
MGNPNVQQGTLNRVRGSIIIPNFPLLKITAPFLGESFISMDLEGEFVTKTKTATGTVDGPEPYVMAHITVGLLRSQALANNWMEQAKSTCELGTIYIHSDSAAFQKQTVHNVSLMKLPPGEFNGKSPEVKLALVGTFFINNNLWSL